MMTNNTIGSSCIYKMAFLRTNNKYLGKHSNQILSLLDATFRGIGQVFFMNSPITGLFCLIAIMVHNPMMGLAAFLSSFLATSFAKLLDFNKDLTAAGIYSYNACLCGCALIVFSGNIIGAWFGIIITSMLSVLVTQCVANVSVPIGITPLTFPFQVSTWLFLLTIQVSSHTTTRYGLVPALNNHISNTTIVTNAAIYTPQIYDGNVFIYNILTGIAQTFLVNNWISGVVMTIGIFLCSPISCFWTILGSTVSTLVAMALGASVESINAGLHGYNGSLVGIALGGFFIVHDNEKSNGGRYKHLLLTCFAILITPFFTSGTAAFFTPVGLPALTWPFTIVTWIMMIALKDISGIKHVPIAQLSCAEDHYEHYDAIFKNDEDDASALLNNKNDDDVKSIELAKKKKMIDNDEFDIENPLRLRSELSIEEEKDAITTLKVIKPAKDNKNKINNDNDDEDNNNSNNDPPPRQNIRLVAVKRMKKNKSFDDLRELDKK